MISKTSMVTPLFFCLLTKVDHYLSAWQVLKSSVHGNNLGANVLNVIIKSIMSEMRTNINVKEFLGDTNNKVKNYMQIKYSHTLIYISLEQKIACQPNLFSL